MKKFVKAIYSGLSQTEKVLAFVALAIGAAKFIADGLKAIYPDIDKQEEVKPPETVNE